MPGPAVVIPNWNGRRWLPGVLGTLAAQTLPAAEVIVVDNGSSDDSLAYLRAEHREVRVIALERNTGFAHAANAGLRAARADAVALINTDIELAPDWLQRMTAALDGDPGSAAVACKMLSLADPREVYDAGDVLRRDGACEQRGRFGRDDGRFDEPGEVFGACAGAALYRREPVLALGGFEERYFAYLEDVDLALRLRLAGWSCRYEPVVALHAGEGSSHQLSGAHHYLIARNTVFLVARFFPAAWAGPVLYRQLAWLREAARTRRLSAHLRGLAAGLRAAVRLGRERRALRAAAVVPVEVAVPWRPWRGPEAGGHPAQRAVGRDR